MPDEFLIQKLLRISSQRQQSVKPRSGPTRAWGLQRSHAVKPAAERSSSLLLNPEGVSRSLARPLGGLVENVTAAENHRPFWDVRLSLSFGDRAFSWCSGYLPSVTFAGCSSLPTLLYLGGHLYRPAEQQQLFP